MRIRWSDKDLAQQVADLAVCFAYEGDDAPRGVADRALRAELARQMQLERFKGRRGDQVVWNTDGRYRARRFLVVGLGAATAHPGEAVRLGCARAARAAASHAARRLAVRLPGSGGASGMVEARAAAEGICQGAYVFDRHLTDASRRGEPIAAVEISSAGAGAALRRAVSLGEIGGRAVRAARDLVNEPPSLLPPPVFAQRAASAAKSAGLRCQILGPKEIDRHALRAIQAVARGSAQPARVVHLTHRPRGLKNRPRVLLVGKGVTFDSGGLNLKPGDSMLHMKADMAGAAAVLAVMQALDAVGCNLEVHGVLGLVENMTGGAAYKPGDILKTWSGKTVEVGNTDAEGRLVLCDLLPWAIERVHPTHVVDVATLTGACVVALGTRVAGLFTRDDGLGASLLAAASTSGEKLWRLPLVEEYLELLQRGPADLCNVAGRWGGAIIAALFLGEFVPRGLPWAHLDIAGPAFVEHDLPEAAAGGSGASVLTLLRWLEAL